MAKEICFDKTKLLSGLDKIADVVSGTLGPKGRNVIFENPLGFEITNDGVTIASQIVLEDMQEDAGAYIIRNITGQAQDDVGDGTTTTALLTQAIIHECLARPENPMKIREALNISTQQVLKVLSKKSVKLKKEDIEKVAFISAEDKTIAKLITEIIGKLGDKAVINVEDSKTFATDYEIVDGYEAQAGFMSPNFINDKKTGKAIFNDVPVLVCEKKISNLIDIAPIFEQFKKNNIGECVIVCDDIDDSMLGVFVQSRVMGTFKSVVIKANADTLKDIEGVTGAQRVSDTTGLTFQEFTLENLGHAKKVVSDASKTLFLVEGKTAKDYANVLEYTTASETNMYIKEKNMYRIAKLKGGIATLRIAAPTDTERTYLRRKAEDAVKATQAALEEGVVSGGGIALWELSKGLGKSLGDIILKKALTAPLRKIIENAGKDYAEILSYMPDGLGYDAKEDKYVDMLKEGIIDPAKVERCAIENAVSTAGTFITVFCAITEAKENDKK